MTMTKYGVEPETLTKEAQDAEEVKKKEKKPEDKKED